MIHTMLISIICLLLSSCATAEYYGALEAQFQADKAKYEAKQAAKEKEKAAPLVDFSWTDESGVKHHMIVNQPSMAYGNQEPEPQRHIQSPWDAPFRFFDRALSTAERTLPWLLGGSGQKDSGNTSYSFGNDAYFQQSRDYSPIDFMRDESVSTDSSTHIGE